MPGNLLPYRFCLSSSSKTRDPALRAVSNHLAAALLVFTLLQMLVINATGGGLPCHLGALVMTALFAIGVRHIERLWLTNRPRSITSLRGRHCFRRDMALLWVAGVALPFLWAPVGWAMVAV